MNKKITIGSRRSKLALIYAQKAKDKIIPIAPARYSCLEIDSIPKMNASGLNIGDKIKTPTKPNITLIVP